MAPRKVTKHSDMEVVDRAAEAGDVSPPKKNRNAAKTVNKSVEEKRIRLPRAAKSVKTEQTEITEPATVVTKNAKTKSKSAKAKNAAAPAKPNSKVKFPEKKNKEAEENVDVDTTNVEIVKNDEEIEMKRTRTKGPIKKAGTEAEEEPKAKSRVKTKKVIANEDIANSEAPTVKKRKPENIEVKETKSKAKPTQKKPITSADTNNKSVNNRDRITTNNETESNDKIVESTVTTKTNKKAVNDKSAKALGARKTRRQKNESTPEDASGDEEEPPVAEKSLSPEPEHLSGNEGQDDENNESEEAESAQLFKKGKNVKKKEASLKKAATKSRGKAINRNADTGSNEDDVDTMKTVKEVQKKMNKKTALITATKKGRGKKGATVTELEENGEKVTDSATIDTNSTEALNANNDAQKSSEEDNDKKQEDSEIEEHIDEVDKASIKVEPTESETINTSVNEGDSQSFRATYPKKNI
ncbi:uncharacterized protein LOC143429591 [Xylocopa sonorina]|uniref:uncharacterized protein LOC143429591 n=1 Tax=Xylocopa sonorina TaxID=1818115 RepID=UPI00403ADAAC